MIRDIKEQDEFFTEGKVYCPMFGKDIMVVFENEVEIKYVEKCANHLAHISDDMVDKICDRISAYHQFMLSQWNDEYVKEINELIPPNVTGRDILNYIIEPKLVVYQPKDGIGYTIEGQCDWEPEHGIEIIIKDDKLLYVGSSSCLGSWANDDEYKVIF
ncbi:hypothetical protein H8356DRAFT_1630259 [Neocallimastix lanati (nom. inval.)]|jgi:hypothetical protein|uniref:DUF6985 domain-containing protein n=1 Tax=Neocallimastix californiae TaxID=1754190 RepID=A0A1Y2ES54_9FUNG|nr:hypothetical protein H8356DRAFT_1630259 [Neocallimastix sp. JGI-2020a]ORY74420.1 hypothetical protein LY90DRAFT_152635 [Neocallimastix californiae]|eukprot:ORY74420.1 hypothetical protein LY90DRAFT_152635 [Neocallimastix californiae]